jgi:glutaredoxin
MKTKLAHILFIPVLLFIVSGGTFAQIYKWVDEDGNVHFSSSPPPNGTAETVKPRVTNTYSSPDIRTTTGDEPSATKVNRKVVMYSAVWCGTCKTAKNYFRRKGIPFTEYDIETSDKGRRDFKRLNGTGVPIILVGKQRMNGFNSNQFESMYGG